MPAGFYSEGAHGVIQIDENWSNMVLVQKGVFAFNNHTYANKMSHSYTGEAPMIFIRPTSLIIHTFGIRRSGNTWTWYFFQKDNGAENVEYYIFDRQPNTETRAGLNVYDSSGRVVFNSDYRPLIVAAAVSTPFAYNQAATSVYIGGSKYAVAQVTPGFNARQISAQAGFYTYQGYRLNSGNTLYATAYNESYGQQGPVANGGNSGGIGLVIDVSRIP